VIGPGDTASLVWGGPFYLLPFFGEDRQPVALIILALLCLLLPGMHRDANCVLVSRIWLSRDEPIANVHSTWTEISAFRRARYSVMASIPVDDEVVG
jgi:hypothetical protein